MRGKDCRQGCRGPIRWSAMERHHSRRTGTPSDDWGVAGICDLVASAHVQQEEKIKTAGRVVGGPIRKTAGRVAGGQGRGHIFADYMKT